MPARRFPPWSVGHRALYKAMTPAEIMHAIKKNNGEVVNNVHVRPHQLIAPFVSVPAVFLSSERRV
jgi:hypothetical protein